ncbi:MAG: hypothetical protein Q9195_001426 [Heterodermia aff. obscurata]
MDVTGNIIDMPIPMLQPRFPLKRTTASIATGSATENGFRSVCCSNSQVPKDRADRNRHAKLYVFRYNQLSPEAIRVIIDGHIKPDCHQWDREVAELKHFAIELQGKAVSTGRPGGKSKWFVEFVGAMVTNLGSLCLSGESSTRSPTGPNCHQRDREVAELKHFAIELQGKAVSTGRPGGKFKWFVEFVGAMVTTSDFYAYLDNLVREAQLASFDVPNELPRDRSLRDAKRANITTMLRLKCSAFKSLLEKDVDIHKASLKSSKSLPIFQRDVTAESDAEEMLEHHGENLHRSAQETWKYVLAPRYENEVIHRNQYQISAKMLSNFWQSKWNVDVASSMYKWAAGVVEITENAYAPDIGDIMATTFIDSGTGEMMKYVLAPRYENEVIRAKSTKPFPTHKFTFLDSAQATWRYVLAPTIRE